MSLRTALAVLLWCAVALPAQSAPLIDNDQVRVLVATDQPHHRSAPHEHPTNRVMIYLDTGQNRISYIGGRVDLQTFRAGDVRWSPGGGKHTSENPGSQPFRVVEVELKTPGQAVTFPALDPVKLDPRHYRVELDNPQARVLRVRLGAKEKVPMHEHALNRVVVYLSDQHIRVTDGEGKTSEVQAKAGEVRWAGPARHSEENLSDKPFEVVVVELK